MQKHKVSHLVRVCDASYDAARVGKEGIEVKDWPFVDGDAPPDAIITQWLDLVTRMSEGKGVMNSPHLLYPVFSLFVPFFMPPSR
jgi:protein tyrosine phosphatase type 4A